MVVAFLTKRVNNTDGDNWFKLVQVLKYSKGTRGLKMTLCADDFYIVRW